jgi:hypothetical protein
MVAATARWLAAYAERHCGSYRATWWVHAGTEPGMRADLVDLGLRLGWVRRDEAEEQSFTKVIDRLSHEGESILLIYDSAIDANTLKPYFTARGAAHVLVTSNARAWRGVAVPVEIRVWTKDIGADYLIVRTGGTEEDRAAAEELAVLLDELPLA